MMYPTCTRFRDSRRSERDSATRPSCCRGRMGPAMPVEAFNASVYLLDRQVEAGRGGHLAVTGPAGSLTYAELAQRVAELAAGLRALGVRPEERVLLVTSDRPET